MKKEALRVTTTVPVAPTTLYFAWLNSEQHAAMTGGPAAKIEPTVGAKFSVLGGYVTGKLVILDLGRRLVMSWRTTDFPRDAHDSRVEIHFEALGPSSRVLVLHTDVPEGQSERYKALWNEKYFSPMRTYFSKFLPDPRNPPVRRPPPPPPEDDEDEDEEETPKGKGAKKPLGKGPSVAKTDAKSAKAAPAKAAPAKAAPAKAAPAKAAPAKAAPAKAAPAKGKPAPAKPAPAKGKPAKKPAKPVAKGKPAKPAAKGKPAKKPAKPAKPAKKKR